MLFPLSSPSWRSSAVETVVVTFCLLPSCLGFHGDEGQCWRRPPCSSLGAFFIFFLDFRCAVQPDPTSSAPRALMWFIHCHRGFPPFPNLSTQQTSCSFVAHGRAPDGAATSPSYHHLSSRRQLPMFRDASP
ncbi:hypothetical protein ACQJBY_059224 [Aegilops geniculata]